MAKSRTAWSTTGDFFLASKLIGCTTSFLRPTSAGIHVLDVGEAPHGLQSFREEYDAYAGAYKVALSLIGELSDYLYSGSYRVDQVFVGLRLYLKGDGVSTLEDRERTGLLGQHEFKF